MQITFPQYLLTMTEAGEGGGGSGDGAGASSENGTGSDAGAGQGGNGTYTPPATQADLDRIITDRLTRERGKFADYDELKARVTEFEQAGLSDAEKLNTKLSETSTSLQTVTAERDQLLTALEHGFITQDQQGKFALDQEALSLLGTGTAEELATRAKAITALRSKQEESAPGFSHGPRGGAPVSGMNDLLFGRRK